MQDRETFTDYPRSMTEIRAERDEGRPTPRDALIAALRDLDSGRISPTQLVIAFEQEHEGDVVSFGSYRSTKSLTNSVGLLEAVKSGVLRESEA